MILGQLVWVLEENVFNILSINFKIMGSQNERLFSRCNLQVPGSAISGNLGGIIGKKIHAALRANRWWRVAQIVYR